MCVTEFRTIKDDMFYFFNGSEDKKEQTIESAWANHTFQQATEN